MDNADIKTLIIRHSSEMSDKKIAEIAKCKTSTVKSLRRVMGIKKRGNINLDSLKKVIEQYYTSKSDKEIADKFGVSEYKIRSTRLDMGLLKKALPKNDVKGFIERNCKGMNPTQVYYEMKSKGLLVSISSITSIMKSLGMYQTKSRSYESKEVVIRYGKGKWNPSHDMIKVSEAAANAMRTFF